MNSLKQLLRSRAPGLLLLEGEPMARHTTFRVGGPAELMALPATEEELLLALRSAAEAGVPAVVIGNGSNLLVRDGGLPGLTVVLGERFSTIEVHQSEITAQAGATLARLAAAAQRAGLSGLEFASGIPGTVGGGVAMNAGAYGGELSQSLVSARVLEGDTVQELALGEMEMGYRTTRPLRRGGVVLGARFHLTPGDPAAIAERMRELNARRREKQPLELPSAGSVFKRPQDRFAGALIEGAGLKGLRVGGAMVSEKHAGFIVNAGGATAADVLALVRRVQAAVLEQYGVELEMEVRVLGVD